MPYKMWEKLGFRESPYSTKPLTVSKLDVDLLMGRNSEQIDFLTAIESDKQGIFILSGPPGVGKTSFLNVQQYLLESEEAEYGPKLLSARCLCCIQPSDEPKFIALRCIQSFCKSIEEYCILSHKAIPKQVSDVSIWIHQKKPATINFGISVLGSGINGGREIHLPSIFETTYETMIEIIKDISLLVIKELGFEGSFIVLDNVENLHDEDLSDCLTTFRDTLFTIPNVWWVLIGQSGLSSLIQSLNPKVFQRLSSGIELKPISVENLIKAVEVRVKTFHSSENKSSSPITKEVYLKLYESSNGEIRFVFKYCQSICIALVQNVRKTIVAKGRTFKEEHFNVLMGTYLVNNQLNDKISYLYLQSIIKEEFNGLNLSINEKLVLKKIGEMGKVSPKDYLEFKEFGVGTMQNFISNYLTKLKDQQLLFRRQEGKKLTYELRGISVFALEYKILES